MKKIVYSFLLTMFSAGMAAAAPGDTTWVQGQTDAWLGTVPTNTDSLMQFPDGSKTYRKIYFVFTLGKYACPGSPQYCADWDYTVQNFIMTPGGDTLEIGRLITPYANSDRLTAAWKGKYVFDVTDMYPVLKNNATVRTHFSGWSGGFTGTAQFMFIEGTPPRNVLGIDRLWRGSYQYGNATTPIDNNVITMSKTAPANTVSTEMKVNITGHGGDATSNCAEFCKKYYQVKVNGNMTEQKDIWRDDCGSNDIYPQNGTWVHNRGNWCPGDLVHTNVHNLNTTGGSNYDVDMDFEAYTGSGNLGSYILEAASYYYAGFNRTLDASLDDIVAPGKDEFHFRSNPYTAQPIVKVKNTGSSTITSLDFSYSVNGAPPYTHTWNGSLAPLAEAEIMLNENWELRTATGNENSFTCEITKVNGQADEDNTNNKLATQFVAAPQWPTSFYITLKTNGSTLGGVSETSWRITLNGNLVKERSGNDPVATYVDTVHLGPGAYRLEIKDEGCDGVNWWAYQFYPQNPGTGSVVVKRSNNNATLPLTGYYKGDFGCGFSQYFNVNWPTRVEEVVADVATAISVYPNPAGTVATLSLEGATQVNGAVSIIDALGRTVSVQQVQDISQQLAISNLPNGVYSVVYADNGTSLKLQTRLVIAK